MSTTEPDLCLDRGPRIGEDGTVCHLAKGHGGSHRAHESWGPNVPTWSQLPKAHPTPVSAQSAEPEWLTNLRQNMLAELSNLRLATVETYTDRAVRLAALYLHPLYRDFAAKDDVIQQRDARIEGLAHDLRVQEDHVQRLRAKVADQEQEIRELNGPPRQYLPLSEITDGHVRAYLRAAREAFERSGQDGFPVMTDTRIVRAGLAAIQWPSREAPRTYLTEDFFCPYCQNGDVAEKALALPLPPEFSDNQVERGLTAQAVIRCPNCEANWIEGLRGEVGSPSSSPEMWEIPASEAREGDTVTITGEVRAISAGRLYIAYGQGSAMTIADADDDVTVTRPVPPLPDKPGTVIRCRIAGLDGVRVAELETGGGWMPTGIDRSYRDGDIELVEVLHTPQLDEKEGI